jgi:hypothetical protein
MVHNFTFIIHPEAEQTSFDLFQKTIEDIRRFIKDIDYSVTREHGKRRWVIESLRSSNPTITIRPLLENEELIQTITGGIDSVSKGTFDPPKHFNEPTLEDLRRMKRLFWGNDRATSIEFTHDNQTAKIERDIGDKVERILRGGYVAFGSIEGTLEAVNLHGSPTFTIWDRVSGAPVRCYFQAGRSWADKVKQLLEKRVIVRGKVKYFANGLPRSINGIEDILDETPKSGLPKATFGSLGSGRPENMDDFLKRVRQGV